MNTTTFNSPSLKSRVESALDSIRPFLHKDGGDIEIVDITCDLIVHVRLLGTCETCPMSFSTMKAGVEESVKAAIPEIKSVIAVD